MMVQGEALGAAFGLLLTSIVEASAKAAAFVSQLERLKSTLRTIKPAIDDIESFNVILERPRHETEAFTARLIEAEHLVRRCSEVGKWNFLMRFYYSKKLSKLEASLLIFFQINVAALQFCESKRILVAVGCLQEKMNEMVEHMRERVSVVDEEMVMET